MALSSIRFRTQHPFAILLWLLLLSAVLNNNAYAQCSLVCKPSLQISLNQNGEALVTTALIAPSAASSCPGAITLDLTNNFGNSLPNPLTCNQLGITITATLTHTQTGNSCSSTITIKDALPPVISCPDIWIWCNEDPDPSIIGVPTATDNCTGTGSLSLTWTDNQTTFNCGTLQNGIAVKSRIDRSWTITDDAGNSAHCTQKVWTKQVSLSAITFPPNRDGVTLPALDCKENPEDLTITGQPSVGGVPLGEYGGCDLGITYADQRIDICPPASYALLRTWTAVDFCLGAISNRIQIIKVLDKTAPSITPPANITVGTAGFTCSGLVNLPTATTSDNCSTVTVTPTWAFGSGYGPFANVPVGTHIITYTALDACSNSRTATMKVTVVDNAPPQAICKSSLQISLSSNGTAYATPSVLDGGSSDNCSAVTMLVSRDGVNFSESQDLFCSDQLAPVVVTLKVTDAVGLSNLCETTLNVRDFLKPDLQCPPNITLNCQQDYTNLSLTGNATASDNCGLDTLFFTNQLNLGGCNIGNLARVWRAVDQAGNMRTCTQQITISALSTVTVQFPANKVLQSCAGPQDLLPAAVGAPVIGGQYCSPLSITYTDNIQSAPTPYCKRIFRSWKVIDGCIYNGNIGSPGIWEATQVINIIDQQAPVIALPAPVVATTGSGGCQAFVDLQDVTATDCSAQISLVHNSPYALANGPNASGLYPVGTHNVVFTATDDCGNTAQKTLSIEVRDLTKPNALCKSNFTLPLNASGQATLVPNDIDAGSNDACTPAFNLSKAVNISNFSCADIGIRQVTLFIGDVSGNLGTCLTAVKVSDPNHVCNPGQGITYMVAGGIKTEQGDTVRSIPVKVSTNSLSIASDCDTTGHFLFEDLPADSIYHIRPYNNANWFNGVSTFDLVLISKHILGILPLTSPYKMIAADANRSGSVTTFDIVQLRKLILGIYDNVPGVTSWRFIPSDFTFSNPNNPFFGGFPEEIVLPGLQSDQLNNHFIGIKVGDMNNSTNPATARALRDTMWLQVPEQSWNLGESRILPLEFPDVSNAEGFQFALQLDTNLAEIERFIYGQPDVFGAEHTALHTRGQVRVSWNTDVQNADIRAKSLLGLQIRAKQAMRTSDFLVLKTSVLQPEWYGPFETSYLGLKIAKPETDLPKILRLLEVFPNPFADQINLSFELGEAQLLDLRIYDTNGQLVFTQTKKCPAGGNFWQIMGNKLPTAGLYGFCLMGSLGENLSGKLLYQP